MNISDAALIEKFADIALRYCTWAEGPPSDSEGEIKIAQRLLAELQLAVLDLPNLIPETDTEDLVRPEQWGMVHSRFLKLPVNGYWDVFDPLKETEKESIFNSLADDLSDIYRDVKEGLLLYDRGLINEAVWEWRFNHTIHWGQHLTGAQRAIHSFFFEIS